MCFGLEGMELFVEVASWKFLMAFGSQTPLFGTEPISRSGHRPLLKSEHA
jgi:hypothetical protein